MTAGQVIYSLNCPQCGGVLEVDEGRTVVTCPFCGISCQVSSQKGLWHFQIRPTVTQEQVLESVPHLLSRLDLVPGLKAKAIIQECFLVYLPYWRAWLRATGWLFGRKAVKQDTVPKEKIIAEDFIWTDAACDVGEFGLQALSPRRIGRLEAFDRKALQSQALVIEPAESSTEALQQAENAFVEKARKQADLSETLFERLQFLQQKLSLLYYPLWVVRYRYRERTYHLVLDGRRVVSGRAPGNPLWQAVALIAAMVVGTTLPVDLMMQSVRIWSSLIRGGVPLSFDLILLGIFTVVFCIGVASLSAAVILAGYSFFRFGGERLVSRKGRFLDQTFWPTGTWSVGLVLFMLLVVAVPWRLDILFPAYALISFASLGLGLLIRHRSPTGRVGLWDEPLGQSDWLWEAQVAATEPTGKPALVPVRCPNCQTPLPAQEGEVAYLCQGCGWGLELAAAGFVLSSSASLTVVATERVRRIEIAFATPQSHPRIKGTRYLPFWVFDGLVRIQTRDAVRHGLLGREKPSPERGAFWREPRRFYGRLLRPDWRT